MTPDTTSADDPHRLPRTVLPRRYGIEVEPDLEGGTFRGELSVVVEVVRPVTRVVLNALGLDVRDASIDGRPAGVTIDAEGQRVALDLDGPLPAGPATLQLRYTGVLDEGMRGFYRIRFAGPDGAERAMAATDFEPTHARRAFPCFDEPDLKATFAVTVVAPPGTTALSSGPVEAEESLPDGRCRVRFAETIPMSTYVVAWVIGPLELTAAEDVAGVPVRIAAPAGRLGLTRYALEAGTHALRWLAGYFSIPYPAAKLDHVAIPNFASGAMENVGCVTYRESLLLADPARASQVELREIVETMVHETAHMWFGNLATMRWWNGLWLNEAFATFMELKGTEAFRPDWDVWTAAAPGRAEALAVDGLAATRPVEYPVGAPEDAEDMFDVLTYQKGGAVLRMLEQYLGEETFRQAIARYLSAHAYGNTETTDLWDALEAASGQPVRATMDGWILQAGYPIVTARRGEDPATVELEQTRFTYRPGDQGTWRVPLVLRASVAGEVQQRRVLLHGPETVRFDGPVEWLVVNGGGWGFHRSAAEASLAPPDLAACTALERITLVDDAWATVLAGSPPDAFVRLARRLGDDVHPDVWTVTARALRLLDRVAADDERHHVAALTREVATPAWRRVGWEPRAGEPAAEAMTRATLLELLGTVGADPDVRAGAAERWAAHRRGGAMVGGDLLGPVVTVVAAGGGADELDQLVDGYREAATPQDRERFLRALPAVEGEQAARRSLELATSPAVRTQDRPALIAGVLAGRQGGTVGWPWFEAHADELAATLPPHLLFDALAGAARIPERDAADRVHRWLADHPLPTSRRWVAQLEERLELTVGLAGRLRGGMAAALAGGTAEGPGTARR